MSVVSLSTHGITATLYKESPLRATVETDQMTGRSLQQEDVEAVAELRADPLVMAMYAAGPVPREKGRATARMFVQRWKEGIPFSGWAFFDKHSKRFVGFANLGFGDARGRAEIAECIHTCFQGQRRGGEIAHAIGCFALLLRQEHYAPSGGVFWSIRATVDPGNAPSRHLLESHMEYIEDTHEKFGRETKLRSVYKLNMVAAYAVHLISEYAPEHNVELLLTEIFRRSMPIAQFG